MDTGTPIQLPPAIHNHNTNNVFNQHNTPMTTTAPKLPSRNSTSSSSNSGYSNTKSTNSVSNPDFVAAKDLSMQSLNLPRNTQGQTANVPNKVGVNNNPKALNQNQSPNLQDEALVVTNVLAKANNELSLSTQREYQIAQAVALQVSEAYQSRMTTLNAQLIQMQHMQLQQIQDFHNQQQFSFYAPNVNMNHMALNPNQVNGNSPNQINNQINGTSALPKPNKKPKVSLNGSVSSFVNNSRWTTEQDEALKRAVQEHDGRNWKAIAAHVPGRDHVQCLQRWKKVLRPGLVKGHWSREEDNLLLQLIQDEKMHSWAMVAEKIPGRTAKQCRERWSLNLDPGINRSPWSAQEDALLLQLHQALGGKWSEIKLEFDGRTENAVKTRYKSLVRAKAREWTKEQDCRLMELRMKHGKNWAAIKREMPGRSRNAIKVRCKALEYDGTGSNDSLGSGSGSVTPSGIKLEQSHSIESHPLNNGLDLSEVQPL